MPAKELIPLDYFSCPINEKSWLENIPVDDMDSCLYVPVWMPLKKHFGFNEGHYSVKLLGDSIAYHYANMKCEKIVFLSHTEAFSVYYIKTMHKIVRYLCKNHDFNGSNFLYVAGAHPVKENVELYKNLCETHHIQPISMALVNAMELHTNSVNGTAHVDFNQVSTHPRKKLKKFISLNGVPRLFRLMMTGQLIKHDLLKESYFTLWLNKKSMTTAMSMGTTYIDDASMQFPNIAQESVEILQKNDHVFPLLLYTPVDSHYNQNDVFLYNTSYFSLVGETVFAKNVGLADDIFYECYDFSEKLFRPIKFKHPFILLARPNSLKVLREYGYKTFHPYIDETYDTIEDDEERLLAVIAEVKRLSELSDSQWLNWQQSIKGIVEHNYDFLSNIDVKTLVYTPDLEDEE